jgi:hypothetical protein
MRQLYLDRKADCELPSSASVAETEVEFLRLLREEVDIVVRGKNLCRWAGNMWLGRGWPVTPLLSPVDELAECAIGAEPGQIAQLYEEHVGVLAQLSRPLRLKAVLGAMYPDGPWEGHGSVRHAAEWILWLDQTDPPSAVLPLLRTQSELWRATSHGPERALYEANAPERARELIAAWLGCVDNAADDDLPPFPLEVPKRHLDAARRSWRGRMVTTRGGHVQELLRRRIPRRMKEIACGIAFSYYEANRGQLTHDMIRALSDYLPPEQTALLRTWLPPTQPDVCPTDTQGVHRWFTEDYLPYRQWCLATGDSAGMIHSCRAARSFAEWLLGFYPAAISSGNDAIGFVRSSKVRANRRGEVVLLVIADGLCVNDAQTLVREIAARDQRLTVCVNDIALSAIPTITNVCKPALVHGCSPRDAANLPTGAPHGVRLLSENQDPKQMLARAIAGDFFIWPYVEPDHTYHSHADATTLLEKVDGVVRTIAKRVVSAAEAVPTHLRLRILVTSDHGRLLGTSDRLIDVPAGMESRQRVSLGPFSQPLPTAGYLFCEDAPMAILNGRRFGISDDSDCAVILSEKSFLTNDGKSGTEHFPHGGLFPEEVLIPWCEILRDQAPTQVECSASGSSREGRPGDVTLHFVNASHVDVTVRAVEFQFRDKPKIEFSLDIALKRMSEREAVVTIDDWPSPSDLRAASAAAQLRLPIGDQETVPVALALESEGFYVRDNILDDLQ